MKHTLKFFLLLFTSFSIAQQTDIVDFKRIEADLKINPIMKEVWGEATYTFEMKKNADSIYIDFGGRRNYIGSIMLNEKHCSMLGGKGCNIGKSTKKLIVFHDFKEGQIYNLEIEFTIWPDMAMYFVGYKNDARNQVWTQGQGKYTSNWLPSIDDVNDKIEFDLTITIGKRKGVEVISNGKLIKKVEHIDGVNIWQYDMQKSMSSYLVALVVGEYNKKTVFSKSGIPLEMYYYPEDSLKVEPTYRYTKEIFDFFEDEIGVAYPWQNYKQVPVHDFLYSGMENTSCTIFSDTYMIDEISFIDKNYVNVNAHELAHQWFGNFVTAKSGSHHWLQEGFATYYALLAEKQLFGEDYFYWRLLEYAQELADQDRAGNGTSLLDPKSSSTTFYKKGAWVLFALRDQVGDEAFQHAVSNYLNKHAYSNVETVDFISEVEKSSGQDLEAFVNKWIKDKTFFYEDAEHMLKKVTPFIEEYLMADCETQNSKCEYYLNSWVSDEAKSKIIAQVPDRVNQETFKSSLKVRQAIAQNLTSIKPELKGLYESLLEDRSYVTQEAALYNLWVNFPEERNTYLNKTKDVIGLSNRNVRMLWLALALATQEYRIDSKPEYLKELIGYTSPAYNFEIRMQAFSVLEAMNILNTDIVKHYQEARMHHNWRLVKFAKEFMQRHQEDPRYISIIEELKS